MTKARLLWISLATSLLLTAWLGLLLLNAASATGDARSEVLRLQERGEQSLRLIRQAWLGRSTDDIKRSANELGLTLDTFEAGVIEAGHLRFEYKDERVTAVGFID